MAKLNFRNSAKGKQCTLRLGNCSSPETVVLAHIGKNRGWAIKCADYFAVYACSNCHDVIDGRQKPMFDMNLEKEKLRALEETLPIFFEEGLMCLK